MTVLTVSSPFFIFPFSFSSFVFLLFHLSVLPSISLLCSSLLSLYSSLFFFFFSFSLFSFSSSFNFFLFFLPLSFFILFTASLFFFISVFHLTCSLSLSPRFPYIYRQKQGRDMDGAATVQPPLHHPRDTSPLFSPTRGKLWASGGLWSTSF